MKKLLTVGVAMVLTACGGGGGENVAPVASTPVATAEGIWVGKNSNGVDLTLAVLENGETWGTASQNGIVFGAIYATTASGGTTLTGSGKNFDIATHTVAATSYTGTFAAKSTIQTANGTGTTYSGTYNPAYDETPSLALLAGNFSGQGVSGTSAVQTIPVTVSASGAISVPTTNGCGASGTTSPRPSGKNIFDVTVTFNGTSCALGNGTITKGIGFFNTTTKRLLVIALNPAKTDGFIYIGQK